MINFIFLGKNKNPSNKSAMKHIVLKILKSGCQMHRLHIKYLTIVFDHEENLHLLRRLQKVFQIMSKNDYRK